MESITLQPSEKQIQDFVAQYQAQLVSSKNPYIRYLLSLIRQLPPSTLQEKSSFKEKKPSRQHNFWAIKRPKKKRHLIGRIVL